MNWLDLAIVAVAAIGLIKGLFDGLIKQVISLISFIFAIFFAGKIAKPLHDFVDHYFTTHTISPYIITAICYIIAFILIIVVFRWLAKLLTKVIMGPVSCLNHILGGFLGSFLSLLILSLLFNLLAIIDSDSKILEEQTKKESILFYKVEAIASLISPILKEVKKSEENLPEPAKDNPQENLTHFAAKYPQKHYLDNYRKTCFIHVAISPNTSGEIVSSMLPYSLGGPVVQC